MVKVKRVTKLEYTSNCFELSFSLQLVLSKCDRMYELQKKGFFFVLFFLFYPNSGVGLEMRARTDKWKMKPALFFTVRDIDCSPIINLSRPHS